MEYAVELYTGKKGMLDFKELFVAQEESEDEDSLSLADVLDAMLKEWPNGFKAMDVAELINTGASVDPLAMSLREFFYPEIKRWVEASVTPKSVSSQLRKYIDNVVVLGDHQLSLHCEDGHKIKKFSVTMKARTPKAG
jgi:hypothetical protein